VLRKVDNIQAMVDDHSVAVACVQAGTTVATALIFAASSGGRESSFGEGLGMTLIFWAVGQVLLVSYITVVDGVTSLPYVSAFSSKLIQCHTVTPTANGAVSSDSSDGGLKATSLFEEAASGNTAAGLSVGLDRARPAACLSPCRVARASTRPLVGLTPPKRSPLVPRQWPTCTCAAAARRRAVVHAGIVITSPIYVGYGLLPWVIYVSIVLGIVSPVIHLYLDHIIMRGVAYSVNVLRHRHWGAAALLGSLKILLALVLMSSYSQNCDPATLSDEFCTEKFPASFVARLGHVSIPDVFTMHVLSNLIILLLFMLVAKAIYFVRFACKDGVSAARTNLRTFSLDAMVADPENNAIAVSLAAFTFAMGLTLVGVVRCPEDNAGRHAAAVLQWTAIGGVLLVLAFAINDCVLLAKISNTEALAQNNVAVACFEAGSLVACGVILRGSLTGGGSNYTMGESLALTVLFWAVSQLMLLIIAYIYRCITFFDDWEQLKKGNVAAGVSGGCTLVALAIIMAYPIPMYVSLLIFVPISVVGIAALMVVRKLVDKCVLPGNALDKEIVDDQNWGAAIIEGGVVVGIAFISNMYVPPPGAPFVSESIPYWDVCQ
jgi:putative membrane protein